MKQPKSAALLAVMIVFLSLAYAHNALAEVASIGFLKFTLISHEPDPVAPGESVELRFRIENWGARKLKA